MSIDLKDAYFHVPIHPASQHLLRFQCRQANVPVQSSAIRASNSTSRVHANRTRSKACSSVSRNLSSPVSRRLVVKSKYQPPMSFTDKRTHSGGTRSRLCDKLRKVRARTYTKNRLSGLQFRFDSGKSLSNRKEVENSRKSCSGHGGHITNNPKVAYVPDRCTSIPRKNNTNGQAPHASVSVVPEDTLAISPVSRPEDSGFKSSEKLSSVVEKPKNLEKGCPLHPQEHNTLIFTDASNQGWGAHLENLTVSGNWTDQEKLLHINVLELKAVFLALKSFQNSILDKRVLIATDNATVVSYLNKQGGTHSWDMCLLVWRIMAYCNPRNILIRARHIQGCLNVIADSLSRKDKIIQTEWSLHPQMFSLICKVWHTPMVDMFATKLNHKLPIYVSPVPDANAMNIDALNISWEGLDGYAFCPVALIPRVIQKMNTYRCRMIVVAPGWPRMHWFWDLVNLSTKPPLQLPHWPHLLKQPFSQKFHQNLMFLNLHVWHLDTTQNHLNHSLSRWQIELRHLKDPHLEDYMSQGGPFLNSGANRIRWSAQSLLSQT